MKKGGGWTNLGNICGKTAAVLTLRICFRPSRAVADVSSSSKDRSSVGTISSMACSPALLYRVLKANAADSRTSWVLSHRAVRMVGIRSSIKLNS
uniref:Uncharacterized protein n=1 Tax=Arundo donax TaxID=35708 RepID=A0A0A9DXP9_ARUDO